MEWLRDAQTPLPYVGVNFAAILLMFVLSKRSPFLLVAAVAGFTLAATLQFLTPLPDGQDDNRLPGYIKFLCEMPLGLGSLAIFGLLSKARQKRHMRIFTYYVNFAVVGNIAMMVFVPAAETMRGWTSRVACVALVAWLVQEMASVEWRPVRYERGVFVFIASPMPWVLAHAFYRMVLISLPAFEMSKYVIMEPASLTFMCIYSRFGGGKDYPTSYYFGASDTLVIATMSAVSLSLGDLSFRPVSEWLVSLAWGEGDKLASETLVQRAVLFGDWVGVCVHVIVTLVALRAIANGPVSGKTVVGKVD
jgi:hypothetical protein